MRFKSSMFIPFLILFKAKFCGKTHTYAVKSVKYDSKYIYFMSCQLNNPVRARGHNLDATVRVYDRNK